VRTLGLIGGLSWESTALYYQALNRAVRDRLGGRWSAPLLIDSLDFAPIAAMQAAGQWEELGARMAASARRLEGAGAQALFLCSNTMHKVADAIEASVSIPFIHIVDTVAAALRARQLKHPLLMGTRFTMEQPFYRDRLAAAGIEAEAPNTPERERLHTAIYDELVQGVVSDGARTAGEAMIARALQHGCDSVILGCTELGLLIDPARIDAPVLDTTLLHAEAGIAFVLQDQCGSRP
jgi:aspartate racemase